MKWLKVAMGVILIATPAVLYFIVMVINEGLIFAVTVVLTVAVLAAMIFGGVVLIGKGLK